MRLTLAAAFLVQALPTWVVASHSKVDLTTGIHPSIPTKKSLSSDINKSTYRSVSAVKEVQPLKNKHIEESRTPEHSSSETINVDVGILGFGYQKYGIVDLSSTIELAKRRRSYDDLLFPPPSVCDPNSEYASKTYCHCSDFDFDNRRGKFSCKSHTNLFLKDDIYATEVITNTIYDDGSVRVDHCYQLLDDNPENHDNSEVCYSQFLSIEDHEESCSIFVNGEMCNSCKPQKTDCNDFDCANTDANIAGSNCSGDDVLFGLLQREESIQKIVDPSMLFPSPRVCDRHSDAYGTYNCDCSSFDWDRMQGSFGCITEETFCLGDDEFCGYNTITNTITKDGDVHTHFCYYIDDEPDSMNVCYSTYGDDACSIHIQGVECNSCQVVNGFMNDEGDVEDRCTQFDCSNTSAGIEGMDCKGDHIFHAMIKGKKHEHEHEQEQEQGSAMSPTSSTAAPEEAIILKSRVLASGFTLKMEANSTGSITFVPLSGPV